ncbi:MAG: hypothetical protein NC118_05320 [Eubacterium sp.]|nr:hypothetical protein [Eubacterium sp.]
MLVVLGNAALLIAKAFAWLIVPKVLGVVEYGYYKTFTLYLVYAMLLHFGFPDGILLLYGGKNYQELKQDEFRTYTKFFICFQTIISVMIIGIALVICSGIKRYIFCMIGIDALFVNLATYYKFISQAVMQFKEYTLRNIIQAMMQILVLGIIVTLDKFEILQPNGAVYILCIVLIDAILFIWYMITYKDLTFGKADSIKKWLPKIKNIFTVGILLTISYQVAHLVFFLDSQMVEILFDVETYSLYAFAYSMTNMITAIISAIATVMFPSLKRLKIQDAVSKFPMLMAAVSIIVFCSLTMYFPLTWFVKWFLPDYTPSLQYLQIIMPGLALSACINLIIFTYYKVLNQLKQYLYIALVILLAGSILNCGGYMLLHEPIAFSIASIITLLIWYLCAVGFLVKSFQTKWFQNFAYVLAEMSIFYIVSSAWGNSWKAMLLYLIGVIVTTCLIYQNDMSRLLGRYRR